MATTPIAGPNGRLISDPYQSSPGAAVSSSSKRMEFTSGADGRIDVDVFRALNLDPAQWTARTPSLLPARFAFAPDSGRLVGDLNSPNEYRTADLEFVAANGDTRKFTIAVKGSAAAIEKPPTDTSGMTRPVPPEVARLGASGALDVDVYRYLNLDRNKYDVQLADRGSDNLQLDAYGRLRGDVGETAALNAGLSQQIDVTVRERDGGSSRQMSVLVGTPSSQQGEDVARSVHLASRNLNDVNPSAGGFDVANWLNANVRKGVADADNVFASGLPDGLVLRNGVLSGTPTDASLREASIVVGHRGLGKTSVSLSLHFPGSEGAPSAPSVQPSDARPPGQDSQLPSSGQKEVSTPAPAGKSSLEPPVPPAAGDVANGPPIRANPGLETALHGTSNSEFSLDAKKYFKNAGGRATYRLLTAPPGLRIDNHSGVLAGRLPALNYTFLPTHTFGLTIFVKNDRGSVGTLIPLVVHRNKVNA